MVEYWKRATIIGGLGSWSDGMDLFLTAHALGWIAATFRIGPDVVGLIGAMWGVGMLVAAIIAGPIIDYIGRKKAWVIANIITGIGYAWMAMAPSEVYLIAGRVVAAIFAGMSTLASVFIIEEAPADKRAFAFGIASFMNILGILNSSLMLSVAVWTGWGWRGNFWYGVIWNIAVAILGAVSLREPPIWFERKKLIEEGKLPKEKRLPLGKLLEPEVRKRFALTCLTYLFIQITGAVVSFIFYFEGAVLKWPYEVSGLIAMPIAVLAACGHIVWTRVSDKVGRIKSLLLSGVLMMLGSLFWPQTGVIIGTGVVLPVILFHKGNFLVHVFDYNGTSSVERTWASELFPTAIRGSATGFRTIFGGIFSATASIVAGLLAASIGIGTAYSFLNAIAGIGLILTIAASWKFETKGIKLE
jgi:putative MFS transporter